jgi:regulator of sirC expression with transglutaminase-like and TPR domain
LTPIVDDLVTPVTIRCTVDAMIDPIAVALEEALNEPGEALAPAALAVSQIEYPRLDPGPWIAQLDEFGREASRRVHGLTNRREQIIAINRLIFGTLGFAGNREQYLDPRNSFLNEVIERRLGIPITLSVVYIEVGRRAGLPLRGIGFPGHFLVGCEQKNAAALVVDPFNAGALLSHSDCRKLLREHAGDEIPWDQAFLAPADRRSIVLRMLSNLKRAYVTLRSFVHARRASDLLIAVDPSAITELRDRGLLSYHLQDFSSALHDLEGYLRIVTRGEPPRFGSPGATPDPDEEESEDEEEFKAIWEHVKNLRRRVASFN